MQLAREEAGPEDASVLRPPPLFTSRPAPSSLANSEESKLVPLDIGITVDEKQDLYQAGIMG